jgi:hypothetical protein
MSMTEDTTAAGKGKSLPRHVVGDGGQKRYDAEVDIEGHPSACMAWTATGIAAAPE